MVRTCTACHHKSLEEINKQLITGTSLRNIAEQFQLKPTSLHRHKENCIPKLLSKSKVGQELISSNSLTTQIEDVRGKIKTLLEQAMDSNDVRVAHLFVQDTLKQIEIEGKLQGQIREQQINITNQVNQLNIYASPEWSEVGDLLRRALADYPELRNRIAVGLAELEDKKRYSNVIEG